MLGLGTFLREDENGLERTVHTEMELEGILNEAAALDPADPQRREFVAKVNKRAKNKQSVIPTDDLRIRSQYGLRLHMLPANIREAIANGQIKVVNMAFYKIVDISGLKQHEIMANADTKLAGFTNINGRKLEENNYFLLTSIVLQSGTKSGELADVEFGIPCREILNGEFSLKNGDKVLMQPSACSIFNTLSKKNVIQGEYRLDNPKFIAPQVEIIPELKIPTAKATLAVKLVLIGAGLVKA